GFRDGELREGRVGVYEDFMWNARVLVAPEPRSAGQVDEELGVGGEAPHLIGGPAVIAAVLVDERPAVAESMRRERVVDIASPIARVGGARVLNRARHAPAGV